MQPRVYSTQTLPADGTIGQTLLDEGRLAEAREQFWSDVTSADLRGDAEALARAALGLGGIWVHEHRSTLERTRIAALQRRALANLDPASPLAHRLRVRLAAEQAYVAGRCAPLLAAVKDARRLNNPAVVAEALSLTHHCLLGPHHGAARLATADELLAVAESTGRPIDSLMGLAWRTIDLFLAGDRRAGRSLRELRERLAVDRCDALRYIVAALDVMLAIRDGRLEQAERAAEACHRLGLAVGDADAFGFYGAQLIAIRWLQGRDEELLPLVRDLAQSPTVPEQSEAFTAALAALAAAAGDHGTARSALASLRRRGLATVPSSGVWLVTLLSIAEAAHVLGDGDAASETYDLLAPFGHLPVMASLAVVCFGSVHRPLGLAAWTMGDLDLAIGHLEAATAADLALGNNPCHVIDTATLADALDQRDGPGDRERAVSLRRWAIEAGRRFGMHARAERWRVRHTGEDVAPEVACDREGHIWRVRFGDREAVVPHCVGIGYLAQLIANVGDTIPAIELASGYALTGRQSWQPVLDARAADRYRQRVADLREEIDDADRCADLERATRARVELDQLMDELARATGQAGRSRSFGHDEERARVAVHKAIKRAIARIAQVEPDLGQEIRARVVTGRRCVFLATPRG